ncbi:unnamed protein product [Schistosoma bovis]|nr:unnamed protein product [Schistosoma bovis]CAH8601020.1 unnamed protein product [Schistosoma bovis]
MKSILKNRGVNIQRSSSLDTKHQTNESLDEEDENDRIESEKSGKSEKKRAFIRDEHGVCRPGELDEDTNMSKNHESRSSVVDRTAAERISYRLVQQRSLDFGLYRKLNNFNIDSNNSPIQSGSQISENDDNSNVSNRLKKDNNEYYDDNDNDDSGDIQHDESFRNIDLEHEEEEEEEDNSTIQNDEFYTNPKIKELGKEFTLKDILGHRVPELEIDIIKDDEEMGQNE